MTYEVDDEFQNQLDFYLKHDRRWFNWFDFHSSYPSVEEEAKFQKDLQHGLHNSGYYIFNALERYPPVYLVSRRPLDDGCD